MNVHIIVRMGFSATRGYVIEHVYKVEHDAPRKLGTFLRKTGLNVQAGRALLDIFLSKKGVDPKDCTVHRL